MRQPARSAATVVKDFKDFKDLKVFKVGRLKCRGRRIIGIFAADLVRILKILRNFVAV